MELELEVLLLVYFALISNYFCLPKQLTGQEI